MLVKSPRYRKPLNSNQVRVLSLIYKFRFVSVPLLSEYLGKDKSTVYECLLGLVSQQYITKNYDSSYRLPPRPATYCLATKGIRYLREHTEANHKALRNMYRNKAASEQLVEQSLKNFKLCNQLQRQYPDTFDIYSKTELVQFDDDFLRPLCDLWLKRTKQQEDKPNEYQVEFIEAGAFSWLLRKRIVAHQDFFDESDEEVYPYILFVTGNDSTERRIQRMLENCFADFEFWTTTVERLESGETKIWRQVFEDDEEDKPILKRL